MDINFFWLEKINQLTLTAVFSFLYILIVAHLQIHLKETPLTLKKCLEIIINRPFSYSTKEPGSSDIFIQFYTRGSTEWR